MRLSPGSGERAGPRLRGRLRLPALNGPVEVLRDRWGVPHIYAASSGDLLFAQGFVHAQDRLWQMDFQRRVVRGRLAEVFGPTVLDTDRSMRILGMYRVAEAEVALLSPESRAELEAYAAGVNAAMSAQPLPVEFTLLRYRPEPWTPADTLCWAKMMAWGLSINWETELLRAQWIDVPGSAASGRVGAGRRGVAHHHGDRRIVPPRPERGSRWRQAGSCRDSLATGLRTGPALGSRLAGQQQLGHRGRAHGQREAAPCQRHAPADIKPRDLVREPPGDARAPTTGWTSLVFPSPASRTLLRGITAVWRGGSPTVFPTFRICSSNACAGGGLASSTSARGEWGAAETREELIQVKGAATAGQEVIVTRHGPVINELAKGLAAGPGADGLPAEPLALRWTSLDPAPEMIDALRSMNAAGSCDEFREVLRGWVAPVQNVVYADVDGNIGYTYAGRIPIRRQGQGKTPAPGWTGE